MKKKRMSRPRFCFFNFKHLVHVVNAICPNCRSWNLGTPSGADRFCSWCGCAWFELEVRVSPETVYLPPLHAQPPNGKSRPRLKKAAEFPSFKLRVQNNGLLPVTVTGIAVAPAETAFFPALQSPPAEATTRSKKRGGRSPGWSLAPGEGREIEGYLHPEKLRQHMHAVAVAALASPPGKDALPLAGRNSPDAPPILGLGEVLGLQKQTAATPAQQSGDDDPGPEILHSLDLYIQIQLVPGGPAPICRVTVMPPPEFELLTPALHLLPAGETHADFLKCEPLLGVRVLNGAAQLLRLQSTQPGLRFTPLSPNGLPVALRAGEENNELRFQVEVAQELVEACRKKDQPLLAGLELVCETPPGIYPLQAAPLKIIPRRSASLAFPDLIGDRAGQKLLQAWALAGRPRLLPVRVKNDGEQALTIYAVEATAELDCLKRKSPALPLRLAAEETAVISFMLEVHGQEMTAIRQGLVAFRFRTEESGSERTAQFALQIEARVPSAFRGLAALDLGARSSCVAVLAQQEGEKETAARLVPIHGEPFMPSAIIYQRVAEERSYAIGRAATAAQKNLDTARCVLDDLKKKLNQDLPRPILIAGAAAPVSLEPRVIIADYVQALLRAAEEQIAEELFQRGQEKEEPDFSACLLSEIMLACPATFTFKQKQTLRQALQELGVKAEQVQPAAAMACFANFKAWLAEWIAGASQESAITRHVLAYDLGAAYTDLALVRFDLAAPTGKKLNDSPALTLQTKILGVDGDEQFGGQSLTAALAKFLAEKALAQLERKMPIRPQLPLWHRAGAVPLLPIARLGFWNWKKLLQIAEQLKCRSHATAAPVETPLHAAIMSTPFAVHVVCDKKLQTAAVDEIAVPAGFVEKILAERLGLHLRKMQKLLQSAKLAKPDLIHVSGGSAVLPVVRETLSRAYDCRIAFAGETRADSTTTSLTSAQHLKASVALGSAQYLQLQQNGGAITNNDNPAKSH